MICRTGLFRVSLDFDLLVIISFNAHPVMSCGVYTKPKLKFRYSVLLDKYNLTGHLPTENSSTSRQRLMEADRQV